jgi:hypothetical protein
MSVPDQEAGVQWVSAQPGPVWNYVECSHVPLSHPSHSAPLPKPPQAQSTSRITEDLPRWNTPRRFALSQIRDQRVADIVRENCHLISF